MMTNAQWSDSTRLGGLRRFAVAITLLNVFGHTVLGFEQSWAQPLVALATAYSLELLLELLESWSQSRPPRFRGGVRSLVDFLLSAHITGLAAAMLLYANNHLWPIAFAVAVAIGSKILIRVPVGDRTRHVFNPSNLGITVTLLAFPWVGSAPPYHFTENLYGMAEWAIPVLILGSGSFVNARFTKRLPLIVSWVGGFVGQAVLRSLVFDTSILAALFPMTGVAFVLYTFYMVTDPATTPSAPRAQLVFGTAVAMTYGLLMLLHVVFGVFFALTIVCAVRGLLLYAYALRQSSTPTKFSTPALEGRLA